MPDARALIEEFSLNEQRGAFELEDVRVHLLAAGVPDNEAVRAVNAWAAEGSYGPEYVDIGLGLLAVSSAMWWPDQIEGGADA